MNDEEKREFLSTLQYFWFEKDSVGFSNFSIERLRQIDPVLADAYERMTIATETFNRLISEEQS